MRNNILFGDVSSPPGQLNGQDWHGLARTGLLVIASSAVTWLVSVVPGLDLGAKTTVILPIVMFALDLARKWLGQQLPPEQG